MNIEKLRLLNGKDNVKVEFVTKRYKVTLLSGDEEIKVFEFGFARYYSRWSSIYYTPSPFILFKADMADVYVAVAIFSKSLWLLLNHGDSPYAKIVKVGYSAKVEDKMLSMIERQRIRHFTDSFVWSYQIAKVWKFYESALSLFAQTISEEDGVSFRFFDEFNRVWEFLEVLGE